MKINKAYKPAFDFWGRFLVLLGGRGSGKSVAVAQKQLTRVMSETGIRLALVRKTFRSIRKSQFQLLKDLIKAYGWREYFEIREVDMEVHCLLTGSALYSAGLDDTERLKSITGLAGGWIEEATELNQWDFHEVDLLLRAGIAEGEESKDVRRQLALTFNPIDANHWLNGYFVQDGRRDSLIIRTTWRDNRFIDDAYKRVLAELKDVDENLWRIYSEGEWGVLKNLIYPPLLLDLKAYPEFEDVFYGLDFGFNNPSALVQIGEKDDEYFTRELIYQTRLNNSELIDRMKGVIPPHLRHRAIYCDSAEPDRINELYNAGFKGARPAKKGLATAAKTAIQDRIDFIKRKKIHSIPENENLNKEWKTYKYREDKNGDPMEEPVNAFNHAINAVEYGIYTHKKTRSMITAEVI